MEKAEERATCEVREAQCRAKATQMLLTAAWGGGKRREGEGPNKAERAALEARTAGQRKRERMRRPQSAHLDGRAKCSVRDVSASMEAEEARRQGRTPRGPLNAALPDDWTPRSKEVRPACGGWNPPACPPSAQGESLHGKHSKRMRPLLESETTIAQLRVEARMIPQSAAEWTRAEACIEDQHARRRRRLWPEDSEGEEGGVGSPSEGAVIGRDEHIHSHA